ncbi:MAG: hypothetical protein LAT54_05110 [Cryomorphaceae bacterium]|nr:hypothetical protein [Cryomorphaceae bacterium]
MKKILIIATTLLSFAIFAQESTHISSAIIAIDQRQDVKEAKEYIDNAHEIIQGKDAASVSKKNMGKYLHYYARIHMAISQSKDEDIRALDDEALDKALAYFFKSYAYETSIKKNYFRDQSKNAIPGILPLITQRGAQFDQMAQMAIQQGNEEDAKMYRQKAYDDFMTAYAYAQKDPINRIDTSLYYNAGLMMVSNQDYETAIKHFEELIDMGYKGISFEGKNVETGKFEIFPNEKTAKVSEERGTHIEVRQSEPVTAELYKMLALSYRQFDQVEKYKETIGKARKLFPENEELIREELSIFLENEEYEKAIANIDASLKNDPENPLFLYIKGTLYYSNIKDFDKAKEAYAGALEIDPEHADANYMMGVLYIDEANKFVEKMNKLTTSAADMKKYDKLKAEQKEVFKKALPYFQKANEVNPGDVDVLRALQQVYFKTGSKEKALAIDDEIEAALSK